VPPIDARATNDALTLLVDKRWLEQRPLLRQDLAAEPEYIAGLGVLLRVETV